MPILQIENQSFQKLSHFPANHTASKWRNQNLNHKGLPTMPSFEFVSYFSFRTHILEAFSYFGAIQFGLLMYILQWF